MQRFCGKVRRLAISAVERFSFSSPSSTRSLHSLYNGIHRPLACPVNTSISNPIFSPPPRPKHHLLDLEFRHSLSPFLVQMNQRRNFASKKKEKKKSPMTPTTSKVKKIKMKSYSSYKSRFRTMNDGKIRRWREGKRHNAHLKSKKAKRRLRKPEIVPAAYAKVMKKLHFCG